MNQDNNRATAIAAIIAFCDAHGYSYKYTEKLFTIELPEVEAIPVLPIPGKRRKTFDIKSWGEKGVDETNTISTDGNPGTRLYGEGYINEKDFPYPDELPPTTTPLEEGEPPKGDEEV